MVSLYFMFFKYTFMYITVYGLLLLPRYRSSVVFNFAIYDVL